MATPTTTWPAIRRQMVATIKALTPTSLSSYSFAVPQIEENDFRTWADEMGNSEAAFRNYEIEDVEDEPEGAQDHQTELRLMSAELVLAYPHAWGWYRTKDANNQWNEATLRAIAHEDRNQLDTAIGVRGSSNYASGQSMCLFGPVTFEEGDGVTFMTIPMTVRFDEAV